MTLDFNAVDPTVVPHFKGGAGEAHAICASLSSEPVCSR